MRAILHPAPTPGRGRGRERGVNSGSRRAAFQSEKSGVSETFDPRRTGVQTNENVGDEIPGPRRARVQTDDNGGGEIFDTRRTGVQTNENNGGAPATAPASGRTGGQPSTSIYGKPGPSRTLPASGRTGGQIPTSTSSQAASGRAIGSSRFPSTPITKINSDEKYRELVSTWFDDAPRGTDSPSGKIGEWNRLKHTMIVMKSDKGQDGKCKWDLRIDYKTKFGLDSQHPHIRIARDNNGGTFLIHPHHILPYLADVPGDEEAEPEEFAFLELEIKKNELTPEKIVKDFSEKLLMSGMDEAMDEEKNLAQKIVDFCAETGPEPGLVIYSMNLHPKRGAFPDTPELSKYIGKERPKVAIIRQKVKTEPELEKYFDYIMTQAVVFGTCWHFNIPLSKKQEWISRAKDPEYTFAHQPWMRLPENQQQPGAVYAAHDTYQRFLYRKMYRDVQSAALVFEMQSQTEMEKATFSNIRQLEAVEDMSRLLHPGEEGYDIQQIIFGTADHYTEEHPIWVNDISPDTGKLIDLYMESATMNEMQVSMVKSVVECKDPVTIGLGPLGIGKSRAVAGTVAVGAICGKHSLVCAPTNAASLQIHGHLKMELAMMSAATGVEYKLVLFPKMDTTRTELTTRVDEMFVDETSLSRHFIKLMVADMNDPLLGQGKRTEATRFMAFYHNYQTGVAVAEEDASWFLSKFKKEWRRVLDECHYVPLIVVSTCNNAHNLQDAKIWTPQLVIIDEAAFCLEADSLIPLTLKKKKHPNKSRHLEKILLVDDDSQQRPVVLSRFRNEYVKTLETSLFTRLASLDPPCIGLNVNFHNGGRWHN